MEFLFLDHARAMFGPCQDHVWPIFTFRLDKALKFSRLSQHCIGHMSMECLIFGAMSGPCLDHAKTMFGLALLLEQLEL